MTVLRGGPLDGADIDLPYSMNGIVDVGYVGDDGIGVAEYRVDGKFRRIVEIGPRVHHPACPESGDDCRCGGDPETWDWEDWDDGVDVIGLLVIGVAVVGALYLLAQIARWARALG